MQLDLKHITMKPLKFFLKVYTIPSTNPFSIFLNKTTNFNEPFWGKVLVLNVKVKLR
jgi:hypothetical protein